VEIDEEDKKSSDLSEFFSVLSKERDDVRQKIKEHIGDPESGLSGLFLQLEEALQDTKEVSVEEDLDNTRLSDDDHNKLENLSSLLNSLSSDKQIPIKVEPEEIIPEEVIPEELVVESEEPQDIEEPQNDIITSVIRNLDDMSRKTQVKEEVDQISSIRKEFDNFRSFISQQIGSLQMSGAGSGETRLEFLDDVDRATAKVDGKALVYDSGDGKWKGESVLTAAITGLDIDGGTDIGAALVDADLFIVDDGAGGTNRKSTLSRLKTYIGAGAADDLGAGDAAVTLTTSSGNITIDAAANNSDIIFKGTDGGADITMLTLDGSADGAAIFKSTVTATGFAGALTGNVTGNASGTAATVTGAAQTNITSLGTLTALTVDNVVINGANIGHTSDTDALAIDSSGNVTASQNLIVSGDFTVNGTTTTISSTNTVVADNLFELNNGAGSNSNDSGIIIERGSTGDNAIIMWDESADKFQIGTTTATASATGNISVTSGILVASSFEGNLTSTAIENSGQTTSDSFNLPITLNGTNGSSANGGDNIVQNTSADENDRLVYEDATPTHYERPITWDRTT